MTRLMFAALLASMLACGFIPRGDVPTPTATAAPSAPPVLPNAVVPTAGSARDPRLPLTLDERCDEIGNNYAKNPGVALITSTTAPRGGESVIVTGHGLPPGEYEIAYGIPQSDAFGSKPVPTTVGPDGELSATIVMVDPGRVGALCLVVWASGPSTKQSLLARPFVLRGRAFQPAPCDQLPTAPAGSEGRPLTLYPVPPSTSSPIGLRGDGFDWQARFFPNNPVTAQIRQIFGDVQVEIPGTGTIDAAGILSFTTTLPPEPQLSGTCVILTASSSAQGQGTPYGYIRFTYP